jgi:alanyl-tRNA synthetase
VGLSADEVRAQFLEFFHKRGHEIVPPSPVVPYDDPTLLFTNAGMNQFKDVFLGAGSRPYRRAADTQPCIRAGGKHNDLDDVGHDTYHHTFFEMLGNWSFGDYFKEEAIRWAWELLTGVWGLDKNRLHATYFGGLKRGADQGSGSRVQGSAAGGGTGVPPVASDRTDEWELEPDHETRELWTRVTDIDPAHVHPGGMKDNFWEMGESGPCGPCSEIHIDLTPDRSGGPLVNAGDPRVIEIWNLVFIQFNREPGGGLKPLPARHVDTGMGLERVTAVLQGHNNNYATDVFVTIIQAIERLSGHRYGESEVRSQKSEVKAQEGPRSQSATSDFLLLTSDLSRYAIFRPDDLRDTACRVIADHIRALTFAIADGCLPDKEGRGYVLRRILRRAFRYGWQYLDLHEPFLHRLVPAVVEVMGEAFPRLKGGAGKSEVRSQKSEVTARGGPRMERTPSDFLLLTSDLTQRVAEIIREEEESFARTLERGIALFEEAAVRAREHHNRIHGEDAFRLHDTFGFPIDLTEIMARERGLTVDIGEYERLMDEARERARQGGAVFAHAAAHFGRLLEGCPPTDDQPKYSSFETEARVVAVLKWVGGDTIWERVEVLSNGQNGALVLDTTCFYVESGGQVSDRGVFSADGNQFDVQDVFKGGTCVVHYGTVTRGRLRTGDRVVARVSERRHPTMQNHTATHLLNWALREVLDPAGEHLQQKGSLVDPEKTRFDFSHPRPVTIEEIERIEALCTQQIRRDLPVETNDNQPVPRDEALKINGLRAVFGEKYPDRVRVVSIGVPVAELLANPANPEWRKYSIEFCGGTHVRRTGEIERFVLTHEEAVAKGVRRLVGVSGQRAKLIQECGSALLLEAAALREASGSALETGLARLQKLAGEAEIPIRDRVRLRAALTELQERARQQQKAAAAETAGTLNARIDELLPGMPRAGGTTLFVAEMPEVPIEQLKGAADRIKQKCKSAAVLLGVRQGAADTAPSGGKVLLLAALTEDLIRRGIRAGDWVKAIAPIVEGAGGGPPTMAQAGGKNAARLGEALEAGREWIAARL